MNNKIKISQLQLETNLKEDALIPIVQDDKTKAIKSKDLLKDYKNLNEKINSIDKRLETIEENNGSPQIPSDGLQGQFLISNGNGTVS